MARDSVVRGTLETCPTAILRQLLWFIRNSRTLLHGKKYGFLFPMTFATGWLEQALLGLGLSGSAPHEPSFLSPHGAGQVALAVVLVGVVAVAEETIFRGYLLLRLTATTRNTVAAVVLSSIVFGMGHGYEGAAGMITVGAMGACFALVYLWSRSLVAPMVMHFLHDFLGIVLLPLLAAK